LYNLCGNIPFFGILFIFSETDGHLVFLSLLIYPVHQNTLM
jgi:hypothetical protein